MSSGVHKFKSSEELYTVYTVVDNGVFSVNLPSSKIFSLPSLLAGKKIKTDSEVYDWYRPYRKISCYKTYPSKELLRELWVGSSDTKLELLSSSATHFYRI